MEGYIERTVRQKQHSGHLAGDMTLLRCDAIRTAAYTTTAVVLMVA